MVNFLDRMLLAPRVARLASRAPRNPHAAWERYWRGIRATGQFGDVLWDSGSLSERTQYAGTITAHFDPTLPVIDVGCGNGTHTRWLAGMFPSVLGVDVSAGAVERARREAEGINNAQFMVLDAAELDAGERLLERLGPANVFVRGVFHVLKPGKQISMAANIRTAIGGSGRLFLAETNFPGSSFAYLEKLGATPRSIPAPLERALEHLPRPGRFGHSERQATFPGTDWRLIEDGPISIEIVPMHSTGPAQRVPGYFAVLAQATGSAPLR